MIGTLRAGPRPVRLILTGIATAVLVTTTLVAAPSPAFAAAVGNNTGGKNIVVHAVRFLSKTKSP